MWNYKGYNFIFSYTLKWQCVKNNVQVFFSIEKQKYLLAKYEQAVSPDLFFNVVTPTVVCMWFWNYISFQKSFFCNKLEHICIISTKFGNDMLKTLATSSKFAEHWFFSRHIFSVSFPEKNDLVFVFNCAHIKFLFVVIHTNKDMFFQVQ